MQMFEIQHAKLANGKIPYREWLASLDKNIQTIIQSRIERLKAGLFGDCKSLKDGVFELRVAVGPGYRVYFGMKENKIVILLTAGNKKSQAKDIGKAKELWQQLKN